MITTIETPGQRYARYAIRDGTSDGALVGGIVGEDEYGLAGLANLSGWAIDVGAHIGTVSVALALDHPTLRIVAVEALPENVAMIRQSVALNGLDARVFVEESAAAAPGESSVDVTYGWSRALNQPDGYMRDNRYIGGMVGPNETSTTIACQALSLDAILAKYEIAEVTLVKIDCEGCEWFFLDTPAVSKVALILGEIHIGRHGNAKQLRAMLEPTHDVEMDDSLVVGHFRAVRR